MKAASKKLTAEIAKSLAIEFMDAYANGGCSVAEYVEDAVAVGFEDDQFRPVRVDGDVLYELMQIEVDNLKKKV